jgi:hypothetical protein
MKVKKTFSCSNHHPQLLETFFSFLPPLLGVLAALLYILLTNDQLGGADSGELVGTSFHLGIAHPPGYPLYIVTAKLFSLVSPFDSVLYTYNLFSTLTFLLAIIILYRSLRLLDIHPLAVFLIGAVYLFSPLNLRWLTVAEVFSLHILLLSAGIYIICHMINRGRITRLSRFLGLVAGMGACNHHSLVFFLPGYLFVYFYYWLRLPGNRTRSIEFIWLATFFLAGLSFYLQPVIVSALQEQPVSSLGMLVDSPQALIDLFLRRMYGTFSMAASDEKASVFYWLWNYIKLSSTRGAGFVVVTGFLLYLTATAEKRSSTIYPAVLLWVAGGFIFLMMIRIKPSPTVPSEIISRMYFTPNLAINFAAVLGLDYLFKKIQINKKIPLILTSGLLSIIILWISLNSGLSSVHKQPVDISLQYGRDILDSCSPDSVLLLNTDVSGFSVFYLQMVEGYRRDVLSIIWPMVQREEYRLMIFNRLADKFKPARQVRKNSIWQQTTFTSQQLISSLVMDGVKIHTLHQDVTSHFPEENNQNTLFLIPSGITNRFMNTPKDEHALIKENIPKIYSYLTWLSRINNSHASALSQWQEAIIEHYLVYLKKMRRLLFSQPAIIPADNLLEALCIFLQDRDREDPYGDFYLGLYYFHFAKNHSEAERFLNSFINKSTEQRQLARDREKAKRLLDIIPASPNN